jgi:peptidoglycan hydrolase CwlO-like protein
MKKFSLYKFIAATLLLLIAATPVFASLSDDLAKNDAKQKALQDQINSARNQENTLANQIQTYNNQIALALLQVDQSQAQLDLVTGDINALTMQIAKLETDLNQLSHTAVIRFQVSRAIREANPLTVAFAGGNFTEDAESLTYQQFIIHKDDELIQEMLKLKKNLGDDKATLLIRQDQAAKNRDALATAKSNLDQQKVSKASLLSITKNNESTYQRMLVVAKKEAEQIVIAYNNKGGSRYVHRGDPIGTEGCTGYCFGAHLHFALYPGSVKTDNSENPCQVLTCQFIADSGNAQDGYVRSGKYLLPIHWPGQSFATVSQWWGMTWFARPPYNGYGGGPHTGIDMYANEGDTIYAADDGQAYFYRGGQTNGNGVFIYHPDGNVTLYWHLQ